MISDDQIEVLHGTTALLLASVQGFMAKKLTLESSSSMVYHLYAQRIH